MKSSMIGRAAAALVVLLLPCLAFATQYAKIAIVAQSGGDYATPSAALAGYQNWCPAPTAADPCLVKIMPGRYVDPIYVWVPYLDVEGSGPHSTIIATHSAAQLT